MPHKILFAEYHVSIYAARVKSDEVNQVIESAKLETVLRELTEAILSAQRHGIKVEVGQ